MTAYYESTYPVPQLLPEFSYDLPLDATALYRTASQVSGTSAPSWASSSSSASYTDSSPSSPLSRGVLMTSPDLSAPLPWLDPLLTADPLLSPSPPFDPGFLDLGFITPTTTTTTTTTAAAAAAAASAAAAAAPGAYAADMTAWNTFFPVLPMVPAPQPEYTLAPEPTPSVPTTPVSPRKYVTSVDSPPPTHHPISPTTTTITSAVSPAESPQLTSPSAYRSSASSSSGYCCLAPGCNARMFKRKADLERHYRHVHMPVAQRDAYFCDYPKCSRAKKDAPFHRRDHLRDHYRDYHKDEIVKRGGMTRAAAAAAAAAEAAETLAAAMTETSLGTDNKREWWRCAKCLRRTNNAHSDCRQCKVPRRGSAASKK